MFFTENFFSSFKIFSLSKPFSLTKSIKNIWIFITYFWKNILSTFTGRFNTFSIVNHEIFLKIILVLNIFEKYKFQYRLLEKKSSIPG